MSSTRKLVRKLTEAETDPNGSPDRNPFSVNRALLQKLESRVADLMYVSSHGLPTAQDQMAMTLKIRHLELQVDRLIQDWDLLVDPA